MNEPVLLLHGGATNHSEFPEREATSLSLDRIVEVASGVLHDRGALAAVAQAVELLEADPLFNAGLGSKLQSDGIPRLSASAMDGARKRFGAVLNVQGICHPSHLVLHLLDQEDRVLDGQGAGTLARELGEPMRSPLTEQRCREWESSRKVEPYGTVGAVAADARGHLAAMTSTGGKGNERPGRVSDSATPAGNYADAMAAISCTGIGEHIFEAAVAPRLAAGVGAGESLAAAADRLERELRTEGRELGFIAVDRTGEWVARWTTECMAHRIWRGELLGGWPRS